MLSDAPPRAHHPHHAAAQLHGQQRGEQQQPSPIYTPRSSQFYNVGFVDVSPPPLTSSPTGHFRFPGAAATLGHRAYQPTQQQQQRRRPDLALMMARTCHPLDPVQMSPPVNAGRITSDMR